MWRHRAESKILLDIPVKTKKCVTVDIHRCTVNLGWWKDKKNGALIGHKNDASNNGLKIGLIKNYPSACRTGHWRQNHEQDDDDYDDDNDDKMYASVTSNT